MRDPVRERWTLEVLHDLSQHLDELDIDTTDGEFYWRCCRQDFAAQVHHARATIAGHRRQYFDDPRRG